MFNRLVPAAQITKIIPGKPIAWKRARRNGKRYFHEKPHQDERARVQALFVDVECIDHPLVVVIAATYALPKAYHRVRQPGKSRPKMSRPDVDNIAKFYLDALNGVLFEDDAQVVKLVASKRFGAQDEPAHVRISWSPVENY
jgi:Holliday junction resolvase RusA-like endonuclease